MNVAKLKPWRQSGVLTSTRTAGEVGFHRNGSALDIWIRVNGQPLWYGIDHDELLAFLNSDRTECKLFAASDNNWEGPDRFAPQMRVPAHHKAG